MIKDIITKKDIEELEKKFDVMGNLTADEGIIWQSSKWSEFQIQSTCYNLFKNAGFGDNAIFVQIDNGGSSIEGIRKKKAATGTQSGFCDAVINAWSPQNGNLSKKSIFIEFKKIGGVISEKQQYWHDFLKQKGESVYFCNNVIFFEKVILNEIKEFLQ